MAADRRSVAWIAAIAAAIVAAAYVLAKGFAGAAYEVDFRFVWLAGRAWAAGIDPYGPGYTALARELFPTGNVVEYWLYPPQWWLPCRLLALLPPARALAAWRLLNAVLAYAAALLVGAGARRAGARLPRWAVLFFPLYPCLMYSVPLTLSYGQTTIVVLFGLALFAYGRLAGREAATVAGLVLCCLKPQFGVPLCAAMLVDRRQWRALALVAAVTLLLSLPQLFAFGVRPTLANLLGNFARHGRLAPNLPPNMTGLSFVLHRLGIEASSGVLVLLLAAALAAVLLLRARAGGPQGAALTVALVCALSCFVLPLHLYDMVALVPAFLLIPLLGGGAALGLGLSAALLFRPTWVAAAFGPAPLMASGSTEPQIALATAAAGIALLAALWGWAAERRAAAGVDKPGRRR